MNDYFVDDDYNDEPELLLTVIVHGCVVIDPDELLTVVYGYFVDDYGNASEEEAFDNLH